MHRYAEFKEQSQSLAAPAASAEAEASIGAVRDAEDSTLAQILDAIADRVSAWAAGARAEIAKEFAGKISYARKYLPRHQVAGAVRALVDARASALDHVARMARTKLSAEREAAIRAYKKNDGARRPQAPPRPTKPDEPSQT